MVATPSLSFHHFFLYFRIIIIRRRRGRDNPSTRAMSSPLHHCKDFHYEKDLTYQLTKQSCNPQEYPAPYSKQSAETYCRLRTKNYTVSTV